MGRHRLHSEKCHQSQCMFNNKNVAMFTDERQAALRLSMFNASSCPWQPHLEAGSPCLLAGSGSCMLSCPPWLGKRWSLVATGSPGLPAIAWQGLSIAASCHYISTAGIQLATNVQLLYQPYGSVLHSCAAAWESAERTCALLDCCSACHCSGVDAMSSSTEPTSSSATSDGFSGDVPRRPTSSRPFTWGFEDFAIKAMPTCLLMAAMRIAGMPQSWAACASPRSAAYAGAVQCNNSAPCSWTVLTCCTLTLP